MKSSFTKPDDLRITRSGARLRDGEESAKGRNARDARTQLRRRVRTGRYIWRLIPRATPKSRGIRRLIEPKTVEAIPSDGGICQFLGDHTVIGTGHTRSWIRLHEGVYSTILDFKESEKCNAWL